jgi:hypothetical protein
VELDSLTPDVTLLWERGGREGLIVTSWAMKLLLDDILPWPLSALQLDGFIFILDFTGFAVCL